MRLYKYENEYTVLEDYEVGQAYKIDKEVVFTRTTDTYDSWLKSGQVISFGEYVLENTLGLALCFEEEGVLYDEEMVNDCLYCYEYAYIDGRLSTMKDFKKAFKKVNCLNVPYDDCFVMTEATVASSELRFIYEKDYDDEYTIQLWVDDKTNKYYKVLIFTEALLLPEVLSTMTKIQCQNEIEELEYI